MKTIIILLISAFVCLSAADPQLPGKNASRAERTAFAIALAHQFDAWQKANPCGVTIDPVSATAQWMLESSWGRCELSSHTKNLGGIKGVGPAGTYNIKTGEVFKGKEVFVKDGFRAYNTFNEFFADYRKIALKMGVAGKSGKSFYQALKDANYATDPKYVDITTQIYNQLIKL